MHGLRAADFLQKRGRRARGGAEGAAMLQFRALAQADQQNVLVAQMQQRIGLAGKLRLGNRRRQLRALIARHETNEGRRGAAGSARGV